MSIQTRIAYGMACCASAAAMTGLMPYIVSAQQAAPPPRPAAETSKPFPGAIRLLLPPRIYAVPGIEMNVYFDNVCLVVNPANYIFDMTCAKGLQQTERWTIVPTTNDIGEFPFVLEVRDEQSKIIARAESTVKIVPKDAGTGRGLTVLTIGDSLTHQGVYQAHLLELCKAEGNPRITLVGHVPETNKPDIRMEGYGGWTAYQFMTYFKAEKRPEGQVDWKVWNASGSPFLYSAGKGKFKVDFAQYCQEFNGGKGPDFATIFLGVNDVTGGSNDENIDKNIDSMFKYYDALIAMIHEVRKDTWIGALLLVPPAATQDAFGENYQCSLTRWQGKRNQQRLVERMTEKYGGRETEFIYLVPANVNIDCVHNYSTQKKSWNSRTKEEVVRLRNAFHPANDGYRQIGDTIYCWLKAQLAAARSFKQ